MKQAPRTKPSESRWTVNRQLLLPGLEPLSWRQRLVVRTLRLPLEQPLQLLLPLLLLQLKLLQLLMTAQLQLLLELLLLLRLLLLLLLLPLMRLLLLLLLLRLLLLRLCLLLMRQLPLQAQFFFFFFPLLLLILLLLLDRVKPDGPRRPSRSLRGLDPLVRGVSICRARAITRLISDSDGVAHSP